MTRVRSKADSTQECFPAVGEPCSVTLSGWRTLTELFYSRVENSKVSVISNSAGLVDGRFSCVVSQEFWKIFDLDQNFVYFCCDVVRLWLLHLNDNNFSRGWICMQWMRAIALTYACCGRMSLNRTGSCELGETGADREQWRSIRIIKLYLYRVLTWFVIILGVFFDIYC